MEEKILNARKNGMAALLLTLLGYVASIALFVSSVLLLEDDRLLLGIPLLILSIAYWIAGIFLFCGLKVLKPQEALVLTLFGDYVGTLKGQGFYWVNPFCAAVNPAAGTRLSQSGDVTSKESGAAALLSVSGQNSQLASSSVSKKISPEDDDPEQLPAEDQRLSGQPGGDRHRRDLAGHRHCQGGVQCGQLQGVPLPPV